MKAEKEVIGLVEELKKHNLESAKAERLKEMICSKIPDDFFRRQYRRYFYRRRTERQTSGEWRVGNTQS